MSTTMTPGDEINFAKSLTQICEDPDTTAGTEKSATEPTQQNHTNSRLLRLPAELRIRIYDYVFDTAHVRMKPTMFEFRPLAHEMICLPTLPAVCRLLRHETLALRNTYTHLDMGEGLNVRYVANSMGDEKCASLRSIIVTPWCARIGFRFHGVKSRFESLCCVRVKGEINFELGGDEIASRLRNFMGKDHLDVQFVS